MAESTTLPFDWADPFALDAQLSVAVAVSLLAGF